MPKLINVAGKIKDTRKRLGMTQKDFILAVSKKLYLSTPLNDSLASQWESNLKNRANPTDEQLAAIAELTSRPWETMWWFMRDDIDHKRGYELYPDGQFTIAPPDMSPDQEEELLASMAAENKEKYSSPIAGKLTAWMKEPSTMWALYEPPEQPIINTQQRALGIAGLLPSALCKRCGYKNLLTANYCADCANPLHTEGIVGLLSDKAANVFKEQVSKATIGGGFHDPKLSTIGGTNETPLQQLSRASQKRLGLTVSRGPVVSDYVDFPPLPPPRPNTNKYETAEDFDYENDKNFWAAVKFFATNDHFINTEYFNQKIQAGAISQTVSYFDGDRAIQLLYIHRDTEMRTLRRSLQNKMMELIFIDRMKKRTSKKMILISLYEKGLKLNALDKHLDEIIHSAELLGVQVRFASGPLEVAESIATFKTQKTFID
jgi:transcriptional regulator with XRE-family HTH domain